MLTDGRRTDDGRTTDARVTGILIAHLGAFGSGELKTSHINFKPWTKHPMPFLQLQPLTNHHTHILHPGQNIPCHFCSPGQNITHTFCTLDKTSNATYFDTLDKTYELRHEISNNVICVTSKASDQPAHTLSLIRAFASHLFILV